MRILPGIGLMVALAGPVAAQVPAGGAVSDGSPLSFNQIQGFAQAEVVLTGGEKHVVFVPLSKNGFAEAVPFFRQEQDIVSGLPPLFLMTDKVNTIYMLSTGLYLERLVVEGRAQRTLAAQVLQGPVELFTFAPVEFRSGSVGYEPRAGAVESQRLWFVRRAGGPVVKVKRGGFAKQMAAYFQDDPVLVETLEDKKLGFEDMRMLVRLYNEHRAAPPK